MVYIFAIVCFDYMRLSSLYYLSSLSLLGSCIGSFKSYLPFDVTPRRLVQCLNAGPFPMDRAAL